jgi:hypothetical protein
LQKEISPVRLTISVRWLVLGLSVIVLGLFLGAPHFSYSQADSRYFPETQHTVHGVFLKYWTEHGGLAQQGYPLTEEFSEVSKLDGKTYTVQYFERAIFERHPENAGTPYEVLLAQLGKFQLDSRYPNGSNPAAAPGSGTGSGTTLPAPAPGGAAPTATPKPVPPAPKVDAYAASASVSNPRPTWNSHVTVSGQLRQGVPSSLAGSLAPIAGSSCTSSG